MKGENKIKSTVNDLDSMLLTICILVLSCINQDE